jgi:hypothetical protein
MKLCDLMEYLREYNQEAEVSVALGTLNYDFFLDYYGDSKHECTKVFILPEDVK